MDIDMQGTWRQLPPWHKTTLLAAAAILLGYSGAYVWLFAH